MWWWLRSPNYNNNNNFCIVNTDGGYGMVLLNDSDATRTILISDGADRFTATIPAKSLASYRW